MNLDWLIARQNADGGWPYQHGASATEPTVLAILALSAAGAGTSAPAGSAKSWLSQQQLGDGGLRPRPNVAVSTWVTALALLVPDSGIRADRALTWVSRQTGLDATLLDRVRLFLASGRGVKRDGERGWSWFQGTAAWTVPTSISLLALHRHSPQSPEAASRIGPGLDFLLSRRCDDGGWNHGAREALGYTATSYPETTGVALLALAIDRSRDLRRTLDFATKLYQSTTSREASAWLELGLRAHGISPAPRAFSREPATINEAAVQVIAEQSRSARTVFL